MKARDLLKQLKEVNPDMEVGDLRLAGHAGVRRKVLHKQIILSKKERHLLFAAMSQVVERRQKSVKAFDRLVQLGLISKDGKCTIEGARTGRLLKRQEEKGDSDGDE